MWYRPCVDCVGLIIWGARAVFMDGCLPPLSSVYAGRYPLDRRCDWWCDQSLHWILSGASSLLSGCHCPVRGRVYSLAVGVEAPRSVSELQFLICSVR